jgi:hypothetical protein
LSGSSTGSDERNQTTDGAPAYRLCSISGCGRRHLAKGLCRDHYYRKARHGDPLGGGTAPGEARKFYEDVVLKYDGDDCLIWPFAKSKSGYGMVLRNGKMSNVSRFVCEDIYGPPPTPEHQAAHSCGRGDDACVSMRHLSWKTPSDNQADRLIHGTHSRGEQHNMVKLSEVQVREIISLKGKEPQRSIARRFGVTFQTVSDIHRGRRWAWVERP